jgi:D-alanine-D-alanine ligase-like ATP-grasp enzyme
MLSAACRIAARADILRATGLAYARRRVREEAAYNAASPGDPAYERIWRETAEATGTELSELADGRLELRRGERSTIVEGNITEIDPPEAVRRALDKPRVHALLTDAGIPVPQHLELDFPDLKAARAELARTGGPLVIKPASGTSGGDGATTGIRTRGELVRAAVRAARTTPRILVEQQIPGDEYRLLFLDGMLLDTVRRRPPSVVGDGRSTVAQLLAQENERRLAARGEDGLKLVTLDLDAVLTLKRAGLTLRSVPDEGQRVPLKGLASQAGRRDSERVDPGVLGDAFVEDCRTAVQAVGLRFGGVDVIAPQTTGRLSEGGGAVIEVNGTPGLHYHYHVAAPDRSSAVALPLLDALLTTTPEPSTP